MKRFTKGESAIANQTVRIEGRTAIAKNRTYQVKGVKYQCCQQSVDIGYMHPTPIVRSCAQCGQKTKASKRVLIPSSYFRRKGEKIDKLEAQIFDLQKLFLKLK